VTACRRPSPFGNNQYYYSEFIFALYSDDLTGLCFVIHRVRKKDATVFRPHASKVLLFVLSVIFLFVPQISREPLNGFAPNSQGIRVWSIARTRLNVMVKGQRSRLPETKMGFSTYFSAMN